MSSSVGSVSPFPSAPSPTSCGPVTMGKNNDRSLGTVKVACTVVVSLMGLVITSPLAGSVKMGTLLWEIRLCSMVSSSLIRPSETILGVTFSAIPTSWLAIVGTKLLWWLYVAEIYYHPSLRGLYDIARRWL